MYNADIEALVLSGELFNGKEASSSPPRTPSPDAGWHDDELAEDEKRNQKSWKSQPQNNQHESVGMGPGRTGVKGVIRDRNEAEGLNRARRDDELDEIRIRMEKSSLGGKTFLEEEREKSEILGEKVDPLVLGERERNAEKQDLWGRQREGRFGHLREIGVKSFLSAVEKEERGIWVAVHLFDPSLERCFVLDETLAKLARKYPNVKFLRARASALGFTKSASTSTKSSYRRDRDDDDEDEDEDEEELFADDDVDLDMLPTLLVYRDGQLVHNWVRVDWEAGAMDIEDLLDKHHILPKQGSASYNLGLPDDDEDDTDLVWSDEEGSPVMR